ncbi:Preprotein translocase subunit SecE [Liberibacter crescens BT-1]|uniref:Protein translocase subunit SecE n=1 Tax=Liberibacter crescens (strain BT-1) TaxID=1215343 RepID=L0EV51_LIBCB|nr:Preprotein translocase subunit SecE [Liberibacter crescens BT-1]
MYMIYKTNLLVFLKQVKSEVKKVVWPSRNEVLMSVIVVFVMIFLASSFFLVADQLIGWLMRLVLNIGN